MDMIFIRNAPAFARGMAQVRSSAIISRKLPCLSTNFMQCNGARTLYSKKLASNLKSLTKNKGLMFGGITFTAVLFGPSVWRYINTALTGPGEALYTNQVVWDSVQRKTKEVTAPLVAATKISKSLIENLPIARRIQGAVKVEGMTFTLLQYQTCPFCCKVRAFLDYFGLPYNVVEVNPVLRQQLKFSKYKKVPILVISRDEEEMALQLNDSTMIISVLTSYFLHNPKLRQSLESILKMYQNLAYTRTDDNNQVNEVINRYFLMYGDHSGETDFKLTDARLSKERKWRQWTDQIFVHVLSPNIYRTMDESIQSFKYFSDVGRWDTVFPAWERNLVIYVGATAMYFVSKRLKKKYSLKDDVRLSLYDLSRYWTRAIGQEHQFMGGDKPDLADLSAYGALSSIEGCGAFQDLVKHTKIKSWYYAVKDNCVNHAGAGDLKIKI